VAWRNFFPAFAMHGNAHQADREVAQTRGLPSATFDQELGAAAAALGATQPG
jgi:hypothetical protein